jgi:hypothetical protein
MSHQKDTVGDAAGVNQYSGYVNMPSGTCEMHMIMAWDTPPILQYAGEY